MKPGNRFFFFFFVLPAAIWLRILAKAAAHRSPINGRFSYPAILH
jgi:hypothetical protein